MQTNERPDDNEGLQGLKALGVRELHYRLAFLATNIAATNKTVNTFDILNDA